MTTRWMYVLMLAALACTAQAQTYPSRTIHIIIGLGAGGITDGVARISAEEMGRRLGQPLVVENRTGAFGTIAANMVKAAPPDGYTLYVGSTTFTPVFIKDGAVTASREMTPISMLGTGDWFMYVPANLPVKDLKELVAYSKANPVRFAAPSAINTMLMAVAAKRLGIVYENIPYKATDQTITAMLNGDAQLSLNAAAGFAPFLSSGKLRVISTLSGRRIDLMPNIPTAIEQGLPLEVYSQISLWGPLGTPADIVGKLNAAAAEALKTTAVIERFRNFSYNPVSSTPAELLRRTEDENKLMIDAAAITGFQPQ